MKAVVVGSERPAGRHALAALPGAAGVASDGDIEGAVEGVDTVLLCSPTWDPALRLRFARAPHPLAARVLGACRQAGVGRLVHLSTALVYGPDHSGRERLMEGTEPRPVHAYERLKLREEQWLRESAGDIEVIVVRAALGFGAGEDLLARILADLERGRLRLISGGRAVRGFVAGPDLGRALAAAAERGRPGPPYLVTGFEGSWHELVGIAAHVLGAPPRVHGLPYDLAYMATLVGELRTPAGRACWPSLLYLDVQAKPHLYEGGRTRRDLVWSPQVGSFEEGVMELAGWYRSLRPAPASPR